MSRRTDPIPPPPSIAPIDVEPADRPFWSVMIPAYEPSAFLERTLQSVLGQDPGPDRMQVAVVDDRSPTVDVDALVDRLAPGRVEVYKNPENLGLAGNWNAAIRHARGHWVHLLHQDDLVLPGFYDRLARADGDDEVGMAFCQTAAFESEGEWMYISILERHGAGPIDNWRRKILRGQRLFCPAAVVRRSIYESVGGFRPDLKFVLDWEMWARIAGVRSAWFEPSVLVCYRVHEQSETSRLRKAGLDIIDGAFGIDLVRDASPPDLRPIVGRELRDLLCREGFAKASRLLEAGEVRPALRLIRTILRCFPSRRRASQALPYLRWALKRSFISGRPSGT